jgi:prevent-host-death family protein
MQTYGAYEAKTHFAQLLDAVERGETITITRHGTPVAILAPPVEERRQDVAAVIAELRALRRTVKLDGLSVREMIEEGRE